MLNLHNIRCTSVYRKLYISCYMYCHIKLKLTSSDIVGAVSALLGSGRDFFAGVFLFFAPFGLPGRLSETWSPYMIIIQVDTAVLLFFAYHISHEHRVTNQQLRTSFKFTLVLAILTSSHRSGFNTLSLMLPAGRAVCFSARKVNK